MLHNLVDVVSLGLLAQELHREALAVMNAVVVESDRDKDHVLVWLLEVLVNKHIKYAVGGLVDLACAGPPLVQEDLKQAVVLEESPKVSVHNSSVERFRHASLVQVEAIRRFDDHGNDRQSEEGFRPRDERIR